MSSIYVSQPKTHGKVILKSTLGEIEIELFSKEAPRACKNFVQLCLEHFYDQKLFHRVIPEFIGQTGCTNQETGQGGESIYGTPFEDEFHSRLKFNQRGMVACAVGNNQNDSQFFITLSQNCEQLNYKHSIFGKVVGETIFNVLKMNQLEIDESSPFKDRPMYPPKIISVEVVNNPFPELQIRPEKFSNSSQSISTNSISTEKVPPKKVTKHVLTFLQDEQEEEGINSTLPTVIAMPMKQKTTKTIVNQPQQPSVTPIISKETSAPKPIKKETKIKESVSQQKVEHKRKASESIDAKQYLQEQREKYKKKKRGEEETLEKFMKFTGKLQNTEEDKDWMSHSLHF